MKREVRLGCCVPFGDETFIIFTHRLRPHCKHVGPIGIGSLERAANARSEPFLPPSNRFAKSPRGIGRPPAARSPFCPDPIRSQNPEERAPPLAGQVCPAKPPGKMGDATLPDVARGRPSSEGELCSPRPRRAPALPGPRRPQRRSSRARKTGNSRSSGQTGSFAYNDIRIDFEVGKTTRPRIPRGGMDIRCKMVMTKHSLYPRSPQPFFDDHDNDPQAVLAPDAR